MQITKGERIVAEALGDIPQTGMPVLTYEKFNTSTLQDIHRIIFGGIYEWAGEFRTIPIMKAEEVLGRDSVRYAMPGEIKKQLDLASKEIAKLKPTENKKELLFKIVRITASIWQTHPFREGNTRSVISCSVLLAAKLGITFDFVLFAKYAAYVRNALVWCTQGIYSKYEYLEKIYFDSAGLLDAIPSVEDSKGQDYSVIEGCRVADYKEQPHTYAENSK